MTDEIRDPTNVSPYPTRHSTHRPRAHTIVKPSADPLHWWRTLAADDFDDLDLRVVVLLLNRYALVRHHLRDALSGSSSEIVSLLARRPSSAGDRDLLMTCLLRSALVGSAEARHFLMQTLRRVGHHALAASWRHGRQDLRHLVLRRKKRAVRRHTPKRRRRKGRQATPLPRYD